MPTLSSGYMALSVSFTAVSKTPFHAFLSFRRPLPILAAAPNLRKDIPLDESSSLHANGKPRNDILGDLHRAIALKHLEERSLDSKEIQDEETRPHVYIEKPPEFRMSLSKLLDQSNVVPVLVYGDIGTMITGVEMDSRKVISGDLFVCCTGYKTDGHLFVNDAIKRGAVAVVACKKIELYAILDSGALVTVEDVDSLLASIAANFYGNPSKYMSVIGVTGTNGKTTTAHLLRAIYEAMEVRTGMLGTVGYHVHGDNQLDVPNTTPDAVTVQKLMARMVMNGTEAVVMEASSHGLALGRCDAIDFDVTIFTKLTRDHYDFHGSEEDYRNSKAKLFARMGKKGVPVVTYAMDNKNADVHPIRFEISLIRTDLLIMTPEGILQISTRLIGRPNIYNILAPVAVGVGVGSSLEVIKRGSEEGHGVYLARWCHGSPVHRYGLFALQWIIELNGKLTPDLETFFECSQGSCSTLMHA